MSVRFLFFLFLIVLLLPSQILMLKVPIWASQDGLYHVERIKQFHQSVLIGEIPPRLAPTLYGGIGYPLFVVNYQLPYYFSEIMMIVTANPYLAFKTVLSMSFILSAIFAFIAFRNFGSNLAALVGTVLFNYLPYRFANLYTRGALGESVALMFVPLVFIAINRLNNHKKHGILLLSLSLFGLITSHTVIFLIFILFFVAYSVIFMKLDKQKAFNLTLGLVWGILLSSFQLIPSIFEKKYLRFDENLVDIFRGHFVSFGQLFRIPQEEVNIGTDIQVGLISTLIIFISFLLLIFKKSMYLFFFLSVIFVSIFLILDQSFLIWENLSFLKYVLYPWRFLSLIIVSVAFLSIYITDKVKYGKFLGLAFIIFALFASRHYYLKSTQLTSGTPSSSLTTQNEFDTIWTNQKTFAERPLISTNAKASIENLSEDGIGLRFNIGADEPAHIIIRKMYFPDWKITINSKPQRVKVDDGLIAFDVEPGIWQVRSYFSESKLRTLGNVLTMLSLLGIPFAIFKARLI